MQSKNVIKTSNCESAIVKCDSKSVIEVQVQNQSLKQHGELKVQTLMLQTL